MKHVTRDDVARVAQTSVAVVSYVINDGPRPVAPDTRQRVLDAIAELGYVPNRAAQALAGQQTPSFGLVIPDITNSYFAGLVRALEEEAFLHGATLILADSAGQRVRETHLIAALLRQRVDGLIVAGVDSEPDIAAATRFGLPIVLVDRVSERPDVSSVSIDNFAAGRDATEQLLRSGRTRLGFIGGPDGLRVSDERIAGFWHALSAAGGTPSAAWRFHSEFTKADGYRIGGLLADLRSRPNGLCVSSDQQAIGLIAALNEHGISVPDDIAIVSIDGTEDGRYCAPSLTSVRQPVDRIAREAMRILTDHEHPAERVIVPHTIVPGQTCTSSPDAEPRPEP